MPIMTDCHVCLSMRMRKPSLVQEGLSKTCVLCCRPYCPLHAASKRPTEDENVCEINHGTYYKNHKYQSKPIFFLPLMLEQKRNGAELLG